MQPLARRIRLPTLIPARYIETLGVVRQRKRMTLLLSIPVLVLLLSCARIPPTYGKSRDVVVISSTIDAQLITDNLQLYNYVPQRESLFAFMFAEDTAINTVKKFHTLFLYGSLQDRFIDVLLDREARTTTETDTFTLFKLEDLWSRHQLVVILAVSEPQYITAGVVRFKDVITEILEENYYNRVKANYYTKQTDKTIQKGLREYGVTFNIAKGWLIDSTHEDENFIVVHTHFPDRAIFFYKEPYAGELSTEYVLNKRDSLTRTYYNGDYVLRDLTDTERIEFKNMRGVRLRGVWQNDSLVAGGPFLSYFLRENDTLYILDGMLFNPGERKTDYFTTVEVILNSFELVER